MNEYPINHLICCPQEKMVNHCGAHSSGLFVRIEADFNQLRLCLDILLNFGHALLKELLAMRKTVSLICIFILNISHMQSLFICLKCFIRFLVYTSKCYHPIHYHNAADQIHTMHHLPSSAFRFVILLLLPSTLPSKDVFL